MGYRSFIFAGLLLGISGSSRVAANVVGPDTQNFNPTTSGLDYVTVHSTKTLSPGVFNLGLFANYAVNASPIYSDSESESQRHTRFNDGTTGGDINAGIGILNGWDLGISLPQVIQQENQSEELHGEFEQSGNTNIRVNSKIRLYGHRGWGIATILSANFFRTTNDPYSGKDPGPTYNLELAVDKGIGNFSVASNIGYRWRNPGEKIDDYPVEPFGNQLIGSLAGSYWSDALDTKFVGEIFSSRPVSQSFDSSDRKQSSAELLLGLKHSLSHHIAIHAGGGSELIHGAASPDWRAYAGLNMSLGPVFAKPNPKSSIKISKKETDPFTNQAPPKREKVVIHNILFEFDSDHLVYGGSHQTLDQLSGYLTRPPHFKKLYIGGHTCSIGKSGYNSGLSKRRAETIKSWLVDVYGLSPNKIFVSGYGEKNPIYSNGNYQGRQLNRRVEFKIYR